MQRSGKLTLILLILVCTVPVIASYVAFYFWQPTEQVNYGELLAPAVLPDVTMAGLDGTEPVDRAAIDGRWTLVYAGPGQCDEACQQSLYAMRQTWLAQGEEMRRVERLWLVSDDTMPAADALQDQRDLKVARAAPEWLDALPGAEAGVHVFLVDPIGNVMMRFPADPDIKLVIKDVSRLLKYSGLGR